VKHVSQDQEIYFRGNIMFHVKHISVKHVSQVKTQL